MRDALAGSTAPVTVSLMAGVSAATLALAIASPAQAGGTGGNGADTLIAGNGGSGSVGTATNAGGAAGGSAGGGINAGSPGQDGDGNVWWTAGGGGGGGNAVSAPYDPGQGGLGSNGGEDGGDGGAAGEIRTSGGSIAAPVTGSDGGDGSGWIGGGGGGGDALLFLGAGDLAVEAALTGGNGGNGGDSGGGGGGGGAGIVFAAGDLVVRATVQGGSGGRGGDKGGPVGGGGGGGGAGVVFAGAGSLVISGTVQGGEGGSGGSNGIGVSGNGGAGGIGVLLDDGSLTNDGTISGGDGGGSGGAGGIGVAAGSNATIVNSGAISGGVAGNGGPRAHAVTFGGGTNRLELRAGSTINGNVLATAGTDDTLALGGDADGSFDLSATGAAAQYRGFEAFEKTGTGTWTLTGAGNQDWSVEAGTLSVDGVLGGAIDVASGGMLAGSGTVGDVTIAGTVAPGNSIGTLHIAGDVTLGSAAVYEVEVDAAGASDRIAATGAAVLQGGAVLALAAAGDYAPETAYTILTADGGVTGTFGSVASSLAFLDPTLGYGATDVTLILTRNDIDFASVAATGNQIAMAGGLGSLTMGNPVYDAVVGLDAAGARAAFDSLSGEIHASARTVLIEDSRFVREAALARLRDASGTVAAPAMPAVAQGPTGAVWGSGFGAWGTTDGDGNAAGLDRTTRGFIIGADGLIAEDWRLGVLAGYSRTSVDVDDRASSADSNNYHLGAHGGRRWGGLGLRLGAAYTWHGLDATRRIAVPGLAEATESSYDARTAQLFGEAGYALDLGPAVLEPFAGLAYVNLHTDGFRESGAAGLTGGSGTTDTTFSTFGLRASTRVTLDGITITARGSASWRHAVGDVTPTATLALDGGAPFAVAGVPIAEDAAIVEAGLDLAVTQAVTLGLSYGGQFGADGRDHGVKGSVTWRF